MENVKRKIILDCDPGHDDAVAIMMALADPIIDLLGITVVAGNQTLENTTRNALNVVQYLGKPCKVYSGCDRPMIREKVIAADIHGSTGLDGPVFPSYPQKAEPEHAVLYIIHTLMESEGDITMVTTGPMTNLGMAIRLEPKIVPKIKQIVLMGGSFTNGNVTPAAEFNIIADADAAHVCFSCGRPIVMCGLDITRKVLCYPEIVQRMARIGNKASKLFEEKMAHFCRTQKEIFGWEGGPLHDPTTIAYLIDSSIITTKPMHAEVDIRSTQSYGRTNCDYWNYQKNEANVDVAVDIDVERFWNLVELELRRYS